MLSLGIVYLGLAILGPVCALLQRLRPAVAPPPVFARDRALDWVYWLVTPLGTGLLTRVVTLGAAACVAFALGMAAPDADALLEAFHARSPLGAQPLPLQALEALLLADLVSYWSHRLRHHPRFFPLHAVHHAPERLDWLAAARMHPLDDLVDNVAVTLPVLLLGFDPLIFLALGPTLLLHTLYLHMDVRLSLGPLGRLLGTPDFHRVHHATDPALRDANFGGVLALWDVLFGTYRMPAKRPTRFGLDTDLLPESLGAQLVVPLRRLAARPDRRLG